MHQGTSPGHTVLPHDDFTRNAVDADGYGAARSGKRLVRLAYDVADVITGRNTVEGESDLPATRIRLVERLPAWVPRPVPKLGPFEIDRKSAA